MSADTSPAGGGVNSRKEIRRQQFTNKQRMDMYAFCVLELEMHSNKVSIKKQQQAIQKVLNEQQLKEGQKDPTQRATFNNTHQKLAPAAPPTKEQNPQPPTPDHSNKPYENSTQDSEQAQEQLPMNNTNCISQMSAQSSQPRHDEASEIACNEHQEQTIDQKKAQIDTTQSHDDSDSILQGIEGKTLLQLQEEVAMTRKCYSDYQRTQVLTSSMLRDVQKRFSKYYPDSAIPSRSTIKHVFEKCVSHGTVENIKNPRKASKIPQGDEIEYLLLHEPQLSLRQMAQKLNVSTGTVSRRCKALGIVPESVTIKHQQLAIARRQKQMKLEEQSKVSPATTSKTSANRTTGNSSIHFNGTSNNHT